MQLLTRGMKGVNISKLSKHIQHNIICFGKFESNANKIGYDETQNRLILLIHSPLYVGAGLVSPMLNSIENTSAHTVE